MEETSYVVVVIVNIRVAGEEDGIKLELDRRGL
jgi:hypothetical protein